MEKRKAHPQRALVGLNLAGGVVPSTGDGVYIGRAQIGQVTSAMRSPALGKIIALARLDTTHNKAETAVEVGNLTASKNGYRQRLCAFPHFDPTKERVKGNY